MIIFLKISLLCLFIILSALILTHIAPKVVDFIINTWKNAF